MTCIPDPGITYETLLPYERERLAEVVANEALDLEYLRDLQATIEECWEGLTQLHPGLQPLAESIAQRATPGTVEHNRMFVGEFPDLPDRRLTWQDEWLIFGAHGCLIDHAGIGALIAVLEHGST